MQNPLMEGIKFKVYLFLIEPKTFTRMYNPINKNEQSMLLKR